ncbi:DNA_pol_B_2 domain-containing protein [Trichonephila clavata]|uniref:DNA-directed DNA polymerase n=1 Tax=Trichonephila clavata TaxID=2740835 RepID=A0A8X6M684_TRICU|nr:DNA_pol_B_2 domain-containing protein [Trichonephila clavata]
MMSTKETYEHYLDVLADKIEYKELDITECIFDFHVMNYLMEFVCKLCSETIKCKHPKSAVEKKKCKECYEIRNKECSHTDKERSFIGTWTTTEVKLTIQKGYEILNIYEVWNFNSKLTDLFRDYVKMFLKIKLETDDKWSNNFKTEEECRRYVMEKLDIELGKIEKNPGLRLIAKICLNSLWGKFGQRKKMQQKPNMSWKILTESY